MGGHASLLTPGTIGESKWVLSDLLDIPIDEPTATVWLHISGTQPDYPGTKIPRSFVVETENGNFWTHGNATEHMNEAVTALDSILGNSNPSLYSQFILYDYRKSLIAATSNGIQYNRLVRSGHWTFKFSKARDSDKYPVVVHALFTGLD